MNHAINLKVTPNVYDFVISVAQQLGRKPDYTDLFGFTAAGYSLEDECLYADTVVANSSVNKIINGEPPYKAATNFLQANKAVVKLIPLIYASSFVSSEQKQITLEELAAKGYDAVILANSDMKLHIADKQSKSNLLESIEVVDTIPGHALVWSKDFWITYFGIFSKHTSKNKPQESCQWH